MATKQRSRTRRSSPSRDRSPRYVAPVLDPNWQSPYAPSAQERHDNGRAVRRYAWHRRLPQTVIVAVVTVALLVGVVIAPWLPAVAVVVAGLYVWDLLRTISRFEERGNVLGAQMLETFTAGGTTKDRLRLVTVIDRLAATFGIDTVSAFIVEDPMYNAALVPNGANYSLFVTSSMMRDFELIEIEGVVAHCMARQRLGLLGQQSVASVVAMSDAARSALAGPGSAYRADEVAAAAIRYPLGLAGALNKCARQTPNPASFFSTSTYAQWRFSWFDFKSDEATSDLSNLDDVQLRALALEEW